ncbi:MAG: hypothetical protein J5693_04695 [Bacteroidales bacterium]|nr:hypothetical protein [Bacteroidales bacterium]
MKKFILILAAFCAILMTSCTKQPAAKQDDNAGPAMRTVTITAKIDEPVTKTSYAEGTTFSWTAGDQISVYCSDGNAYTFTATSTAAETTFTGSLPDGVNLGSRAFFPADDNHNLKEYQYSIPETKDMTGHPSADIPMIGDKGEGDSYAFKHCCGASKLTITNIPDKFEAIEIAVSHPSLKLSGVFGVFTDSGYWRWNPKTASTDAEKNFVRKVAVVDNEASIYIPYASGSEWWGTNTLAVTGFDAANEATTLVSDKSMKSIGAVERAHVKPLTPLVLSSLQFVDWASEDVETSTLDPSNSKKALTELKVTSDEFFMYCRVASTVDAFTGDFLDIYLSDGDGGDNYAISNSSHYWNTGGTVVYREEHKGNITASSLSMTFNGSSIETVVDKDGDNIYWSMAFPRSAHELLSEGTVYVAFMLWNGWSCAGAIPSRYTTMLPVMLH